MALLWFMILCVHLATSSLATDQESKLSVNQTNIKLDVYHIQAPGSSFIAAEYSSLSDILLHDEEHVKALSDRLTNKGVSSTSVGPQVSEHLLKPNSDSIPLNPGVSIASGNYYVKIGLGSPPKYYSMFLDTGSSLSWLQCQPCTIYCHSQVDPIFDPLTSKTYKTLSCSTSECSSLKSATLNDPLCTSSGKCIYTASYGDASYSVGYLSKDVLTLGPSLTLPGFTFGCGQDNEGMFGRGAGILGIARDKLSLLNQYSIKYGSYAFSYCLPTPSASSRGGFFSIGKISASSYKFTPMIVNPQSSSLYFLRMTAITVAGRPLPVTAAAYKVPTIIDSGTVITRLPMSLYAALKQAFVKIMSAKYQQAPAFSILDACFKGNVKSMLATPQIRMIFQGGAELALRTSNILIQVDEGVACLAFAGNSGTKQIAIIGNHQQQTFNVAYDVSNSRIGFAVGACH